MPEFDTRQLTPADVREMNALRAVFADAFDDHQRYAEARPSDAYLARLLGRDHFIALVAKDGEQIVAGLTAYELEKYEKAYSEIYIYDLAVLEAHRRKGIATALIAHLRHIAAARDVEVIFVQADYGDDPAVALYTKLGAREDVMHFDIAVGRTV
ncbi:MAG: AAC(3)-I family aminoglycoside N-acetyltransferase [Beijerinckiaceae bacterium]